MKLHIHADSHVDHLTPEMIYYVTNYFERQDFEPGQVVIETIELDPAVAKAGGLTSALYGPAAGDEPIPEHDVRYARRGGRAWASRLIDEPERPTRLLTVIAGPHDGHDLVLFTAHGGPPAPREPWEIGAGPGFDESVAFWHQHALAAGER